MSAISHRTILFLCTGNYYRSRFAEIYFNWHAARNNLAWRAESRGLALDPANLGNMSRYTVGHLGQLEIPISPYERLPQDLTAQDLEAAHRIVAVKETEHRPLMTARFPDWLHKVEFWQVHDIDCASPEEALPHLEREVTKLLDRLSNDPHA
ncbi:low molecular weight phosphatase family protein [Schlesneria sp. DSM 10557]|uniref:arsenate reductase/protein-tyrosine-phosphatase family protein n=1 Tax=Schlesneria sp. DSM 10557 TaxID=3044399 RepID=UPI00359F6C7F